MGCMAAALLLAAGGCTDDVDIYHGGTAQGSDCISFSIEEADVWVANGTRSDDASSLPSPLDPEIIPLNNPSGDPLYLHISAIPTSVYNASLASSSETTYTRGALVASTSEIAGKIGLIGYKKKGDAYDYANPIETFLTNNGTNWIPDDVSLRWRSATDTYEFYAYYPFEDNHISISGIETGTPTISYVNSGTVARDTDLLVAHIEATRNKYESSGVPLTFTHPLASVRFKTAQGFKECKITSFSFGNPEDKIFESSAELPLKFKTEKKNIDGVEKDIDLLDSEWTPNADAAKCNFSLVLGGNGSGYDEDGIIGGNTQTLMVIPTDYNTGLNPKINLTLEIDGSRFSSPESGLTVPSFPIQAGYTTTYVISNSSDVEISDPILEVPYKILVDHLEHDDSFQIRSSVKINGIDIPLSWSAEIVMDENDNPEKKDSISVLTPTGGGFSLNSDVRIKILAQKAIQDDQHAQILFSNPIKGKTTSRHDLSMENGCRNSSNCYIVNSAGYYKLPLVYGNSIKDGHNNETCGIGNDNFIDYKGNKINHVEGEIGTTINVPDRGEAVLLWHDASLLIPQTSPDGTITLKYEGNQNANIIQNIDIERNGEGGYDYLTFDVPHELGIIQQANAVIGVVDDEDNVMWSWHIWFTDFDPSTQSLICKNEATENPYEYSVFLYPLGYCSGPETEYYLERSFKVKITQDKFPEEPKYVDIVQQFYEKAAQNNVVMYQSRRKDPFPAAMQADGVNTVVYENINVGTDKDGNEISNYIKKCYDNSGTSESMKYGFKMFYRTVDIDETILHPNEFYFQHDGKNDLCWYEYKKYTVTDSKGKTKEYTNTKADLWTFGLNQTNKTTTNPSNNLKTIYDPCPPGYMVPPSSFWDIWNGSKQFAMENISKIKDNRGVWLWCYGQNKEGTAPITSGGKFFLSANGRRNLGEIDRIGRYCMYWDTGIGDNGGRRFWMDDEKASTGGVGASAGASVLPVAEQ